MSAESWDFRSLRSEGRLGYLSQCPHIAGSHQVVLWYTQASHCAQTHPGHGWRAGPTDAEAPTKQRGVFARGSCHPCKLHWATRVGEQPFLPLLWYLSTFPPQSSLVFPIPQLCVGFLGSFLVPPPTITLCSPWYTYRCSLLLQGKLGRKQIHGHTANKIPPWAEQTVVWSPGLQELIRSCLVAAVTRVLGATQTSTPAAGPLSKAGAGTRLFGLPN